VTGTLPTGSPIQGLAIDPTNPLAAYVGVQGFVGSLGTGHVFQTTNGGTSWTDITGNLPDAPVNSIVVDSPPATAVTDVYVATDAGVFVTESVSGSSTSWMRLMATTGLPDSTVLQIKMSETCPRALIAATHGRGAWSICPITNYCPPTPTPTFSPTPTGTPLPAFTAQAVPNTSTDGSPINFKVNLPTAGKIILSIYDVAGESLYAVQVQGTAGVNTIPWAVQNQQGDALASGLYIYYVQAGDGSSGEKTTGKVLVRH
jgi:hypothetical protein